MGNQFYRGGAADVSVEQFQERLGSAEPVVVKFYAPWCGYCKRFAPEYDKFADQVSGHQVLKVNMDTASNKKALERTEIAQLVKGYPTVLYFKRSGAGHVVRVYGGERTAEAMLRTADADL